MKKLTIIELIANQQKIEEDIQAIKIDKKIIEEKRREIFPDDYLEELTKNLQSNLRSILA